MPDGMKSDEVKQEQSNRSAVELLGELVSTFRRHLSIPNYAPEAIALSTVHAHCHDAATHSPILAAISPERRCGKSTLLGVLKCLVPNPLATSNITEAAVFRSIERDQPTLLIDEADTFLVGARSGFRGILNAGFQRSAASVSRTEPTKDGYEPKSFNVWGPKAIFAIGSLHPTLMDRSIEIRMMRKLPSEKVERFTRETDELRDLKSRLEQLAKDHIETLREAEPAMPAGLHDRAADSWRPLLAIADLAGDHWPETARRAAVSLTPDFEESPGILLLEDIRTIFDEQKADRLPSATIRAELKKRIDRSWSEWGSGESAGPISETQIASLLRPFGIFPDVLRFGDETKRGYKREWFEDAWARYLPRAQQPEMEVV